MNIPLFPYAPENMVSRRVFSRTIPRYSPVPVRACEFGFARRVQPYRPASACSFSMLRLNLALTRGVPPDFRATSIYLFKPPYAARKSGHCREFAGTGPLVLKVVPVTAAAILQASMEQLMYASLFSHPLLVLVRSGLVKSIGSRFSRKVRG